MAQGITNRGAIASFVALTAVSLSFSTTSVAQFRPEERRNGERVVYEGSVAWVHGEDGPRNRLLWLPDGTIVTVPAEEIQPTQEAFFSLPSEAIAKRLLANPALRTLDATITNHYLVLSNATEGFRTAATRILESMVPGMALHVRAMKLPLHAPVTPMVVVMFRSRDEFQAYRKVPQHVAAYYEPVSNQVVVCEAVTRGVPQLALQQQLATIAHEGAHQILHNIGVQQRLSLWPAWLNEGLAEYFAPTTFGKRMTWKGSGEVNDWRMYELERFLKSGAGAGELVGHTLIAERLTSTGYATSWALTHYLAERRRNEFHELMRHYSATKPLQGAEDAHNGIVLSQRIAFSKIVTGDFGQLESRIVDHLRKLPYRDPYADLPHYAAFAMITKENNEVSRAADIFHSRKDAERWCQTKRTGAGSVRTVVREFTNRAKAEAYARRWLAVSSK